MGRREERRGWGGERQAERRSSILRGKTQREAEGAATEICGETAIERGGERGVKGGGVRERGRESELA